MRIAIQTKNRELRWHTQQLLNRMLNPLVGIAQQIGLINRGRNEPKIFTSGVDLSGAHVLLNLPPPKRGAYHIGGSGIYLDEAMIRSLGESIERYAQLIAEKNNNLPILINTYEEMEWKKENILSRDKFQFFDSEQLQRASFPFKSFEKNMPMCWIKTKSFLSNKEIWIPMQFLFVGYSLKKGECWLNTSVTTGTAVHTNYPQALRNALLELIQIDSAMGHWYTASQAHEIILDERTTAFEALLKKTITSTINRQKFYLLPNPDLTGFIIACVIEKDCQPYFSVGLGADTSLTKALYKAYLEAIGVMQLAKIILIAEKNNESNSIDKPDSFFDLDNNVGFYAKIKSNIRMMENFNNHSSIKASDLPEDDLRPINAQIRSIIKCFEKTGKELIHLDLTTREARDLGLVVSRVWSPDILSLCMPSAVPKLHKRFRDFGGIAHDDPHPYP